MPSRNEELLEALLNDESVEIDPKTRVEAYLKACCEKCGCEGLPKPISREDRLMYELAEKMAHGNVTVEPLNVTENGTYTAEEKHAYSPVNVNVPIPPDPTGNINITDTAQTDVSQYATAQVVDADLVAENIKKDVNILGVTGTFEGGGGGASNVKIYDLTFTSSMQLSFSPSVLRDDFLTTIKNEPNLLISLIYDGLYQSSYGIVSAIHANHKIDPGYSNRICGCFVSNNGQSVATTTEPINSASPGNNYFKIGEIGNLFLKITSISNASLYGKYKLIVTW